MLKNDKWIKRMAKEKRIIEPFEEKQVKKGVISFGLSSYGYDIRLSDEFKIFTNVFNSIVDPKNFDPKSFVDFKGEVCVIPPNSFVLGKSLEYFRIPRDVLGICVGKSTYARCGIIVNITPLEPCYDKETEILTLKGWKKFEDLEDDEIVATLNPITHELEYQRITAKQKIWFEGEMIQISGRNIDLRVTPAHLIYAKNKYKERFEFIRADEIYGKYNYELKRDAIWKGKRVDYFEIPGGLKRGHHLNFVKNLKRVVNAIGTETLSTIEIAERTGINRNSLRYYLRELNNRGLLKYKSLANRHKFWMRQNESLETLSEFDEPIRIPIDSWVRFFGLWLAEGSAYFNKKKGDYVVKIAAFKEEELFEAEKILKELPFKYFRTKSGFTILNKQLCLYLMQFGRSYEKYIPEEIKSLPREQLRLFLESYMLGDGNLETQTITTTSKRMADDLQEIILKAGWASIVREIPKERYKSRILKGHSVIPKHNVYKIRISKKQLTPKIYKRSFSKVPYKDYVYDVTVPNHTLYVRRNGKACWSSNCWEGYLTIEISNTTPLPVKVYANEGIAQVIFLGAEEECEVSYKDKKGKYQEQKGIELPKIDK